MYSFDMGSIKEAADLLGVDSETLRRWETYEQELVRMFQRYHSILSEIIW
jgi:DNA-binding transcriptional MerR regulator